jgi:hypothetical protein
MAHQTGGIFFLLPSHETNLVRGSNRKYELEAMRGYKPDLRSREAIIRDRDMSEMRQVIYTIIIRDLNPYDEESQKIVEMRRHFAPDIARFKEQAQKELAKAKIYVTYLDAAVKKLDDIRRLRDEEPELRWRANYDLLYAQLLAYKVRIYEYGAYLEEFCRNPPVVPMTKQATWLGQMQAVKLVYWDLRTRKETLTGELTASTIERANELFAEVSESHPGTPWDARAKWEKRRGYGVEFVPVYHGPWRKIPPGTERIPVPKL